MSKRNKRSTSLQRTASIIKPQKTENLENTKNHQNIPEKVNHQLTHVEQHFSGPIPPPELLAQYNQVVENGADRIMRMAELQSSHRMELEKNIVDASIKRSNQGLYLGFTLALVCILGGIIITINGQNVVGITSILIPLGAIVSIFVYTKERDRENKENKTRKTTPKSKP